MTKKENNEGRHPLFQCVTELYGIFFLGIFIKEAAGVFVAPF